MRNSLLIAIVATVVSAALTGAAGQQPSESAVAIVVANPVSLADGTVGGGSSPFRLGMHEVRVVFAYSGKTLCDPTAPTEEVPKEFSQGWRLEITPMTQGTAGVEAKIRWQRLTADLTSVAQRLAAATRVWEKMQADGVKPTHPDAVSVRRLIGNLEAQLPAAWPPNETRVTLRPGSRVTLDYLGATQRNVSPNMAAEVSHVTGCNALGMGLEVGIEPARTIVETDLWLIQKRVDKTEESQHQTLRVRAGDSAMYWFDAVLVPVTPAFRIGALSPSTRANQAGQDQSVAAVKVSGRLAPTDLGDGKIHMKLTIARSGAGPRHHGIGGNAPSDITIEPPAGGATYDVTAEPGEVLSFQLPALQGNGGSAPAGTLSVRFRARILPNAPPLTAPAPKTPVSATGGSAR